MDLCNINEIKALLARHGFHFSKAKGQNFLTQSWVPQNIVLESGVDETCGVLEVGPGIGPLTQQLCRYAKKVVAVEVDRTLQPILAETMAGNENLEIIFGDILKTDISALVQEEFAGLRPMACANLPYYITTPVLAALLESRAFEAVTVMVQKEVAQRICSPAGKGDYGAFSAVFLRRRISGFDQALVVILLQRFQISLGLLQLIRILRFQHEEGIADVDLLTGRDQHAGNLAGLLDRDVIDLAGLDGPLPADAGVDRAGGHLLRGDLWQRGVHDRF